MVTHVTIDRDLEDLIPGYIENRCTDLVFIHEALAAGDFVKIRVIGHSIKGSGGGYGFFDRITDIGRELEDAARAGQAKKIDRLSGELSCYLNDLHVYHE